MVTQVPFRWGGIGKSKDRAKNGEKPHLYPIPSRLRPLWLHLFSAVGVCQRAFFLSFGLDEASVRSAKICRINFIFFPKCLIFPAKSSLTF
jgi:hypothetical protein